MNRIIGGAFPQNFAKEFTFWGRCHWCFWERGEWETETLPEAGPETDRVWMAMGPPRPAAALPGGGRSHFKPQPAFYLFLRLSPSSSLVSSVFAAALPFLRVSVAGVAGLLDLRED